jgi:hypothetical protein
MFHPGGKMEKAPGPITRVKIGPIVYKVKVVPNLKDTDGKHMYGSIDYAKNELTLNLHEVQTMNQTLFHEVLHGILHNAGITDISESVLDVLATGIYALLKDNPKLRNP